MFLSLPLFAQEAGAGALTPIESVARDDLKSANQVTVSDDGKFVYTTSWAAMSVNVFSRDDKSGRVQHVQTVTSRRDLNGVTALALSPDGRLAATSAFRSQALALFARDGESGRLRLLDSVRNGENEVKGLVWAIDLAFSPDSEFLYVVAPEGSRPVSGDGDSGAVTVFEVTKDQRLRWIETNTGQESCFNGARGVVAHPNGRWLYVAANNAACVTAVERNPRSGKTQVRQIIRDGEGGANGLRGVVSLAIGPDGRFLYVNSGRFSGDNGVTAFALGKNGELNFLEEHLAETGEVKNFVGGNTLALTPDGRNLYAAATRSGSLACFARNPQTGKLIYRETLADGAGRGELGGAAGVAVSPDGRHVYVTAEFENTLTVYRRE